MKKVLNVIYSLKGGGAETQLALLVENDPLNRQAVFCCDRSDVEYCNKDVLVRVSPRKSIYNLKYLSGFISLLREFGPDVVHIWLPASITIPTMILAKLYGARVIFSYRSTMAFHRGLSVFEFMIALLFSDKIVSNNKIEYSQLLYRKLFRIKSGVVIGNAVAAVGGEIEREFYAATTRILYAGRLTRKKDVPCLLRALALVNFDWSLDLCGTGEQFEEIRCLVADLGLDGKVEMRGYCDDIWRYYDSSDLLVSPSLWEGMPNALVEAMTRGLPCVVSDIPQHRDLLCGDGALEFFEPGSAEKLADKLNELVHNKTKLESMSLLGREMSDVYSVEKMTSKYSSVYQEIM